MLVVDLSFKGVHHHRAVVGANNVLVAQFLEGPDNAFQLPGRGGTGRVPVLPGDIDFKKGGQLRVQVLLNPSHEHRFFNVLEDGLRSGGDHCYHSRTRDLLRRRSASF
jgi:hypothetical protein